MDVMPSTDDTPTDARHEAHGCEPVPCWLVVLCAALVVGVTVLAFLVFRTPIHRQVAEAKPGGLEIERWSDKVASSPNDPANHVGLAYAYQRAGDDEKALASYDRALKLRPDDPGALYNKGAILLRKGAPADGERILRRVVREHPDHVMAAKSLAQHYAALKRWEAVLQVVQPAVAARPDLADLHFLAGLAYEHTGDRARARQEYEQAVRFGPDMREASEALKRVSR